MHNQLRAASYCRVSTTHQADEGLSLDAQQDRVSGYIAQQGWAHVESFVERGVSGRRRERPELDRLMASLDDFDVLVIPKFDRLGRSSRHMLEVYDRLEAADVRLISLSENIDTSTAVGRFVRTMFSANAELESENISERVRAVSGARARAGRHHGGPRPYGYEHRSGDLIVVPDEALIIRRIYDLFLAGQSQRRIAQDLNAEKVPALKTRWTQSMISRILRTSLYMGKVTLNGADHPGTHQPVVSAETWAKAAALRDGSTRTKLAGRGKPSRRFLLTRGALRCGLCGGSMVVRSDSDCYECSTRKADVNGCDQRPIKRAKVDGALIGYFMTCGLDEEATRAQLQGAIDQQLAEVRSLREQAERQEQQATESLARIRRDFKAGELTASEWRDFRDELTGEQEAARSEARRLRQQEQRTAEAHELRDVEADVLRQLADLRQTIASEVVEARGLEAVRAALLRLFVSFTLGSAADDAPAPEEPPDSVLDAVDVDRDYVIWTEPRATALAGLDENFVPIFERVALHGDWQNEHDAFAHVVVREASVLQRAPHVVGAGGWISAPPTWRLVAHRTPTLTSRGPQVRGTSTAASSFG